MTARSDLSDARQIIHIKLYKIAARSAYYAAFHAAEALIVEKTGKSAKSHRGVRIQFARLTKDKPPPTRNLANFFVLAYQFKEVSDYSTDQTKTVTAEDAKSAIATASDFVEWAEATLA